MGDTNSLINFDGLTKPAITLIEKISEAIGGIYKPYQIKRIAKAEAEAEKIRAVAHIEITDLQRRAMARFFSEEAKKQNNIESITSKALPEVTEEARPDQIEDDWITYFFDKCRLISDEDMQSLWAKVLAGQANSPGRYSKRTVEILSYLEQTDAILFSKLCSYVWDMEGLIIPFIYDINNRIYSDHGITFRVVSHLESLGLVQFNASGYLWKANGQKGFVRYFDKKMRYDFQELNNNDLEAGLVILTQAGKQLVPICGAQPLDGFVDYVKKNWMNSGFKTESDTEQSVASDDAVN